MTDNLQQTYIRFANEFRGSKGSKESLANLYDLLYHLETMARSPNEDRILSNVQSLLGYHKSAYDTFKPTVATDDRKELKKLYKLQDMAQSHGDFFATKDPRKCRSLPKPPPLSAADFQQGDDGAHSYVPLKDIVIFNQSVAPDNISIELPESHSFEEVAERIIAYIEWLGDCKKELIAFYNAHMDDYADTPADTEWYDGLEVIQVDLGISEKGTPFADITVGDTFMPDHLLDMEFEAQQLQTMGYDG